METNYYSFYTLYFKYRYANNPFTDFDLIQLTNLSALCPGLNGSSVYQALALYQLITGNVFNGVENCSANLKYRKQNNKKQKLFENDWIVNLYPNPNYGNFMISTTGKNEIREISIHDISGKLLFHEFNKTESSNYTLDIKRANGMYFITIKNQKNESSIKKMVVAK